MSNGLIHLYHGDGKGKTTAAMGLAVRALGCGRRVVIVQFLKGGATGELEPLQTLGATFYRGKAGQKFVFQMNEEEKAATRALQTENLRRALAEPADLLILDEACAAWNLNMVDRELLQNAVLHKPAEQELAMTGRDPAPGCWMPQITLLKCAAAATHTKKAFRQEKALNFKFAAAQFHTGKRTRQ